MYAREVRMKIETTIHIDRKIGERLADAAVDAGVSVSFLVSGLMRMFGGREQHRVTAWKQVRYQERREKKRWRKMHLSLREDEYEYFIDTRKVFKLSVSFIVAEAIELYLDELLRKMIERPDNYRYRNYIFSRNIIENVICFTFYWGVPQNLLTVPEQPPV